MASSDEKQGRDSQPFAGYAALIVCGVLLLGLMPFSVGRMGDLQPSSPQVQRTKPIGMIELRPEAPAPKPPISGPPVEPSEDATGQTSRLFKRLRTLDAQPRPQAKPVVNPLREPDSQPKRKSERPGAAELLFDELP